MPDISSYTLTPLRFIFSFLALLALTTSSHANTRYVTDSFQITMRSGPSTSNSIISMLKSGDPVEVLDRDIESGYSKVKTLTGKEGFVLTRFLEALPSARYRLQKLTEQSSNSIATISTLEQQISELQQQLSDNMEEKNALATELDITKQDLQDLTQATRNTVEIINENDYLKSQIQDFQAKTGQLEAENLQYRDKTAMDWFIRGAGVFFVAFLIGILVTRIRWKKRDSWGSF